MKYPSYQKYSETKVPWLPTFPKNWDVRRLKFMSIIKNGFDYKHIEVDATEDGYPVYGSGGEFRKASEYLYDGESILYGRKGTIDKPLYVKGKFWTVDTMFYSEVEKSVFVKFMYYSALTIQYSYLATQTALPSINQNDLSNYWLAFPLFEEQTQIAKFLDYKTAQIDRLIEKKKALIEKLNEQRIAMITQAVTKGLNPDAPMKDSEVDWLGEVPEHWELRKLKWTIDKLKNGVWGEDKNGIDDLVCIRVADFNRINFCIDDSNLTLRAIEKKDRSGRLLKKGDLLIEKSGGGEKQFVGVVVEFDNSFPAVTSNFVAKMEVSKGVVSRYLTYLHSYLYSIRLNYRSIKQTTGIQNLDAELYFAELVAIAPEQEQTQIAKYLDDKTAHIDKLVNKTTEAIEKLNEYRTALITAAVTGKIDVRNWEPTSG